MQSSLMAPSAVIPEHLVSSIAYVQPTQLQALSQLGLRISGVEELVSIIVNWKNANSPSEDTHSNKRKLPRWMQKHARMVIPRGTFKATRQFQFAKPLLTGKRTPTWVSSSERFQRGECMSTIAMRQLDGKKPILEKTVANHLLTSLLYCYPLSLSRFFEEVPDFCLNQDEWDKIEEAAALAAQKPLNGDYCGGPQLIRSLVSWDVVAIGFKDRTEIQNAEYSKWSCKVSVWQHLQQAGFEVHWDNNTPQEIEVNKAQRV